MDAGQALLHQCRCRCHNSPAAMHTRGRTTCYRGRGGIREHLGGDDLGLDLLYGGVEELGNVSEGVAEL